MSETRPPIDAPARIDRYEVIAELGRGSMGKVYLAHDPNTDRRVALKVRSARTDTDPEEERSSRARFLLEGRAAGRLQHPGIVVVYDADTDTETGQAFLAMEWIEGQSLATLLKRKGPMAWATAARIAAEVALALDHAHERGVVHRDVKPANILVGVDGRVKVSDFGIAKVLSAEPRTLAGQVLGTPHYMSPEQLRSDPLDGRSDLFSLGAVLYEMLTGEPPFPGDTVASVTYKIAWVDPRPPSFGRDDLPAALERIVLRLLAKSPEDRFARGKELADALTAVIADPGEVSQTTTLPRQRPVARPGDEPAAPERRRRHPFLSGLLAAAELGAISAGALFLTSLPVPEPPPEPPPPVRVASDPPQRWRAAPAAETGESAEAGAIAAAEEVPEPPREAPTQARARQPRPRTSTRDTPSELARALAALPAPFSGSAPQPPPPRPAPAPSPAPAPPAVDWATLELVHNNRLRGGWMTVWVDGERVWSRSLQAPESVLERVMGEHIRIPLRLAPGEHEIEVRIAKPSAHIDAGARTRGRLGPGQRRQLRVSLRPYVKKLGLEWDP